ncbi:conserved hypothetical protein [Halorhabdus utahensis DSM 12940]|uniref:Uncharacterized protein n=1 Tax=Halorhabdus utahensis (strain DSM 12940 / JCM 11049 / AX-2) TaxID=519442 RepID=C7NTY8_HALUD|nr:hypothetical protein [Halorhabdus utahensis]ACV12233.1 conserved hypothetical protein [Halorhabdus utahensis DSM 12940]
MPTEDTVNTHDTVRERSQTTRIVSWLLLSGNRLLVAGILAAMFFLVFTISTFILRPEVYQMDTEGDLSERLFSTMIIVIVTGTTIVVTFGQLILTQENGPLGDQFERLDGAMEFRDRASVLIGAPCSTKPSKFLSDILEATSERAELVQDIDDAGNEDLARDLTDLSEGIVTNAQDVRTQLETAEFGTFDVVFAALNFDYSWKVFQVERIVDDYEDDLTAEQVALLDELKEALMLYGPAREYIKTLYFQWSLIALSQVILAAAVPALILAGTMLVSLDGNTFPGRTFGIEHIIPVIGISFTMTLLPFMVFISYIFRIFTVAKRTLAIDPLIPRQS